MAGSMRLIGTGEAAMAITGRQAAIWIVRVGLATATLAAAGMMAEPGRAVAGKPYAARSH